ncbi:probable serine/threonine-protein kinase WNK11 [Tanacetum coccineum]
MFDKEGERGRYMIPVNNLLIRKTHNEASRMFFETPVPVDIVVDHSVQVDVIGKQFWSLLLSGGDIRLFKTCLCFPQDLILKGLNYLHTYDPCIIHRDLNCSNIYINVNTGKVKIGDFGLASMVGKSHMTHFVIGTPEYMAPKLYEENYNELVDIYSFGLCLLEMDIMDIPYMKCNCIAQIYHKVTKGVMPLALNKAKDPELKAFIEKCIGQKRVRPSASELLNDMFLEINDDEK